MSQQLISLSPDLKRLQDEGFHVEVKNGHLLVHEVPYVNAAREVKRGTLVSTLALQADETTTPDTHVAYLVGEYPCNADGTPIEKIRHQSSEQTLAPGVLVHHSFSSKPIRGHYTDYHEKMATYAAILSTPAQVLEPDSTPRTFPVFEVTDESSVFCYVDTASSRAGIAAVSNKLGLTKVSIVGLGGTGSYILDLVAKTPVGEIHLFDGDTFSQHNAFRAPGAASIIDLKARQPKVEYLAAIYSRMRKNIRPHPLFMDASNVHLLDGSDFVFLCMDSGSAKEVIVAHLENLGIPFVDVGLGIDLRAGNTLGGQIRVTASTDKRRDHVRGKNRISFAEAGNNDYTTNIQVADLNALNAALAVVRWKKHFGFYSDLEEEHHSVYVLDGNSIANDDPP